MTGIGRLRRFGRRFHPALRSQAVLWFGAAGEKGGGGQMDRVEALFDRMDAWRHLPKYQLERRSDIFFSLYLSEVLEAKFGFPIRPEVTPEFPVRKATIYSHLRGDDCCNIDYLALSASGTESVFVELKTDQASRRVQQDDYLLRAQQVGLPALLGGICSIFRATTKPYRLKWFALMVHLREMGLLQIPASLCDIMACESHRGAPDASNGIVITAPSATPHIVYVQPLAGEAGDNSVISFEEYADVVSRHADPLSQRFAESLLEWASIKAGGRPNEVPT